MRQSSSQRNLKLSFNLIGSFILNVKDTDLLGAVFYFINETFWERFRKYIVEEGINHACYLLFIQFLSSFKFSLLLFIC